MQALILTLQEIYEESGNIEANGDQLTLSFYGVVTGIIFLGEILNLLAFLIATHKKKIINFLTLNYVGECHGADQLYQR